MAQAPRRALAITFLLGFGSALAVAGPLIGGIAGVFTIERSASGGNTPQAVAHRIYASKRLKHYKTVDLPVLEFNKESECKERQLLKWNATPRNIRPAFNRINLSIDIAARDLKDAYIDSEIEDQLSRLSSFALGALEGCIKSSFLSVFCEIYVQRVADEAKRTPSLLKKLTQEDSANEKVWCYLFNQPESPAK